MRQMMLAAALTLTPALAQAQESKSPPEGTAELPKACQEASPGQGMMGKAMEMGGMASHSMSEMGEAQSSSMEAMMVMNRTMRATHAIKDPDLSFICGMIAHHRGAIAMSKVELKHGKDEKARAWAQKIIDEQQKEVVEFEAWAERRSN
jgi:uncharacterized protein (DUF305 family)